jgi:hypothetical protein
MPTATGFFQGFSMLDLVVHFLLIPERQPGGFPCSPSPLSLTNVNCLTKSRTTSAIGMPAKRRGKKVSLGVDVAGYGPREPTYHSMWNVNCWAGARLGFLGRSLDVRNPIGNCTGIAVLSAFAELRRPE